jgi:hypothetical protein
MPPRYTYWTIIVDDLPTAFRAAKRDELLPTFERLRVKHPSARLQWFARGRLWESPEQARLAETARRPEKRGRDWRPGGEHKDPRDRFDKKKRARDRAAREAAETSRDALREGWRRDRPPQVSFSGRPARPGDRRPKGPGPTARGPSGNRGRQFDAKRGSPRDLRPHSAGSQRFGSSRDERRERRGAKPDHERAGPRPPRPKDRRWDPKRERDSRAPRGTMPGTRPGYRPERPPRGPSDDRQERRRQVPPPRPPGPDREPKPGKEPPPVPARSEDIIAPTPPPERGRGVPGPQGTRLMKRRPPRTRE